ncbi:MAG TPA: hypothetical protein VK686_07110 [Bryobacteraceae bacterium]|nr:hypothetical protein [Bryobacteraceae bacterium]
MELLLSIQRVLWAACLLAESLVIFRLLRERLVNRYPLFASFLLIDIVCSIVLMQIKFVSWGYSDAFRICTLIMTVFRLAVAAELYERICEHFPGIGTFRIGMAGALVLLAALLTVVTFRPNLVDQWVLPRTIALVIQRFQSEILAGALVLTWLFLRYVLSIRQPFQPNVLNHWRIAAVYFGVSGAAALAVLLTGRIVAIVTINSVMLLAQSLCFVAWFRLLSASGEELPPFRRLSPDQVKAVERYNRELLETVRSLPSEIAQQEENRGTPLRRSRPR